MRATGRAARTPGVVIGLLLTVLVLGPVSPAQAEDVWRIAGTMNNWNAQDPEWTLERHPDRSWVFRMEKLLEPGRHRFKFVKNGAWQQGHFGMAEGGARTLEQPGDDIPLIVEGLAFYRIELNVQDRTWLKEIAKVEQPIVRPYLYGNGRVAEPMLLDLRDTISAGEPWELRVAFDYDPQMVKVTRRGAMGPDAMKADVIPLAPGEITIGVRVIDGEEEGSAAVRFEAAYPRSVELLDAAGEIVADAALSRVNEPADNYRALLSLERSTEVAEVRLIVGQTEADRIEFGGALKLEAGSYEITTRGDELMRDSRVGAIASLAMWPAPNWVRFSYPGVDSEGDWNRYVHLVGDFNTWAQPGQRGSIELERRLGETGRPEFVTWQALSDGAHEYAFFVDAIDRVRDPRAERHTDRYTSVVFVGERPNEFAAPRPDDVNSRAVRHDPSFASYFAQLSDGLGLVDASLRALPGDLERVVLEVSPDDGEPFEVEMHAAPDASGWDFWRARVMAGASAFSYRFRMIDGETEQTTPPYRATLDQDVIDVPDWAKGAVYYQIFPERFRNGNPLNDPNGPDVYQMPWTSDWYEVSAEEEAAWRERFDVEADEDFPPRQGGPLFHVVWDRRYGGDLQGVVEKLDYLKEMGITAIYFNPVFEGESMHKYDATDFRHIDDNFGLPESAGMAPPDFEHTGDEYDDPATWRWTESDRYFLDVLLPEAKERGIHVVIDGVWNHTGRDFWAFEDVMEKGAESKYADWFYCTFDDEGELIGWVTWDNPDPMGQGWLPKFRQTADRDLIQPIKDHLFAVTERWMDPNGDGDPSDGVDGWRLDVPLDVGAPFWVDWRKHVKRINPEAVIIAEIWGEDEADPWISGDHFDTQMHYPFAEAVTDWLGVEPGMTSGELVERLEAAFDNAPQTNLIHQNLFGSHDTDRYVSKLINPNRSYDGGNRPQDNGPNYRDVRPEPEVYEKSLLGVAIQATYMGAPMVYYGDEVGMWGADDPTNRKPFPWPDAGSMANPDENADFELYERYAAWFSLRHDPQTAELTRFGSLRHLETRDDDVFAFVRELNGRRLVTVVNKGRSGYGAWSVLRQLGDVDRDVTLHRFGGEANAWNTIAEDTPGRARSLRVEPMDAAVFVLDR